MGVDPDPEAFGDSSGVALQFLYSLLELKAGMMETQFRPGFAELVRAICRVEGLAEPKTILQTWTRNMIRNDLETTQIATQSVGVISDQTILKNHPWVEDVEAEHMVVSCTLLYNQHRTLARFPHARLAAYTHRELREEVLDGNGNTEL